MSGMVFDYDAIRARLNGSKVDEEAALMEYTGKWHEKSRELYYKHLGTDTLAWEQLPLYIKKYFVECIQWIKDNPIP